MTVEHDDDLVGLLRVGAAVAAARDAALAAMAPGVSTAELDQLVAEVLASHGARSAPALAYGFPGSCCISVNDRIAHGVPSPDVRLREGDVVNVDVSAEIDGYWADTGASTGVGHVAPEVGRLLRATRYAQRDAMAAARAGRTLRDVARAAERQARRHGYRIVENLCGHGVGRHIHEAPNVPSTARAAGRTVLWEGLVLAIEPFLSPTSSHAVEDDDGWTLRTDDGSLGAQYEHSIVVTRGEPIVLTASAAQTRS